jgi:hypothetical protein
VQALIERRRALGQDGSDEVWEGKFDFYGRHDVAEILVVDLAERSVQLWIWDDSVSSYRQRDDSSILGDLPSGTRVVNSLAPAQPFMNPAVHEPSRS